MLFLTNLLIVFVAKVVGWVFIGDWTMNVVQFVGDVLSYFGEVVFIDVDF